MSLAASTYEHLIPFLPLIAIAAYSSLRHVFYSLILFIQTGTARSFREEPSERTFTALNDVNISHVTRAKLKEVNQYDVQSLGR